MDEKMEDDDFDAQPLFAAALALPDATRNSFYFARTSDQLSKRLQDDNTTAASSELPLGWKKLKEKEQCNTSIYWQERVALGLEPGKRMIF